MESKTYLIEVTLQSKYEEGESELDRLMNFMLRRLNEEQRAINSVQFRDWKIKELDHLRITIQNKTVRYERELGGYTASTEMVEVADPEGAYIKWENLNEHSSLRPHH